MNCPTREVPEPHSGFSSSPLATPVSLVSDSHDSDVPKHRTDHDRQEESNRLKSGKSHVVIDEQGTDSGPEKSSTPCRQSLGPDDAPPPSRSGKGWVDRTKTYAADLKTAVWKVARYIGPGLLIAVAYMDPGNYATDVAAGASYQYKLLVMVLVSNIIAIFLQSLAIRLGTITGLNLAENCRAHCPKWLNLALFVFAQAAIVATDVAEVIGTAVALNMLTNLNLVIGCLVSIADVFIILMFYNPDGGMKGRRMFEALVVAFVMAVVICFCIELSKVHITNVGSLFRGYLPSSALIQSNGLLQACGILGATVMPHSLYLGSGLVQGRLQEWDRSHGHISPTYRASSSSSSLTLQTSRDSAARVTDEKYRPSLPAIRACMRWSITELAVALFTFALFVNSAILIIAGASLSSIPGAADANLFSIHTLLSKIVGSAAGVAFALALLFSGISAGIVCTMAGQMVTEGQITWRIRPWVQRLATRSMSLIPSLIVAAAYGKEGVSRALTGSQVALSVILPIVSAPLIYFTCRNRYMTVRDGVTEGGVGLRNGKVLAGFSIVIWGLIVVMNAALIVLTAMGKG